MLTYTYKAKTNEGVELKGVIQAVDDYDAARKIRVNAPIIVELKQVKEKGNFLTMDIGTGRIDLKNLSVMCSQIAITLRSGIPLRVACQ